MAIVISVVIVFLGALAVETLPRSQFHSIASPSVVVAVSYPVSPVIAQDGRTTRIDAILAPPRPRPAAGQLASIHACFGGPGR